MTTLGNLNAVDLGGLATGPQALVFQDHATSEVHVRSHIRAQHCPWHCAALHLMGYKFYCRVLPTILDFIIGFDMRVGIQTALANQIHVTSRDMCAILPSVCFFAVWRYCLWC
jgi:hypothetical protein